MTDEKFTFIEDCKDKKRTARGAFNKRTHCGKGGAVMFPSDYLTTKEKKAMNGECKSYRLNDPMKWKEFKYMPQDLQRDYITALRNRFGANNNVLFEMLGISRAAGSKYFAKIGLSLGKGKTPGKFDEEAWTRWVNGLPAAPVEESVVDEAAIQEYAEKDIESIRELCEALQNIKEDPVRELCKAPDADISDLPSGVSYIRVPQYDTGNRASISSGTLSFSGNVYDILQRLGTIIGNENVEMTVVWDLKED